MNARKRLAMSYLCGVLHGDGWCNEVGRIGLRVRDRDFAEAFTTAINLVFGVEMTAKLVRHVGCRYYWTARMSRIDGRFLSIRKHTPRGLKEKAAWLRGFFDSEGNAQLIPLPKVSKHSVQRAVRMFSTCETTISTAHSYLDFLGISATQYQMKNTTGHLGSKIVICLAVRHGKENFVKFATLVGSNIARKRTVLAKIPKSYRPDFIAHCRKNQLKGARTKHHNLLLVTVPTVIKGIAEMIAQGIIPTQRQCAGIKGFYSVQRHYTQCGLIRMARSLLKSVG